MTFEKQFPRLVGETIAPFRNNRQFVEVRDIMEHCLDKQKVREEFEELELALEDDDYFAISKAVNEFKKELGL